MEKTLVMLLGARIRTLRKTRGWSQDQLAEASSINQKYVSEIERGRVNGSLVIYDAIAKGLGLTLSELTEGLQPNESGDGILALLRQVGTLDEKGRKLVLEVLKGALKGLGH